MVQSSAWPPAWLTEVPESAIAAGDGDYIIHFAEKFGTITKDSVAGAAGSKMVLRDWQKEIIKRVFARDPDGGLRHRVSLIGISRKNGKSALGSLIAAAALLDPRAKGSEIYSVAADRQQARIVFEETKRLIEASELREHCTIYRDSIYVPSTNNVYRVLSADAPRHEGLSPTLVLFDELHAQPNRALFDVMSLAQGARGKQATMVAITTAGLKTETSTGQDSICYSLYKYGKQLVKKELSDPTFMFCWYEAPEGADHRKPETWYAANPGIDDICAYSDFESAVMRTPEAEFRTKRCNQFVNTSNAWLPAGTWDNLADDFEMHPDDEYIMGFDGSWKNDSTALVAVILPREEGDPYRVKLVRAWEKNFTLDDDSWRVDKHEVSQHLLEFYENYPRMRELVCDPSLWEEELWDWNNAGLPVVAYRNSTERTIPATAKLFDAIMSGAIRHDGNPAMARHLDNCILKVDNRGARITKDFRQPKNKVDIAISLMMAYDRASGRMEEQVVPQFFF